MVPIDIDAGRLLVACWQGLSVAVGDRPELQATRQLAGGDVLGPLGVGQEDARFAHLKGVVDLAGRVAVVQRRRNHSRPEAGQVVHHQIDSVRHQRGNPIAGLEAEPAVAAGEPRARPVELPPAERANCRHHRDVVRRPLEADAQQLVERPCGSIERRAIDQHRAILRGVSDRTRTGTAWTTTSGAA
jgi:hypothetical protein